MITLRAINIFTQIFGLTKKIVVAAAGELGLAC
jgi:hypothetical protein